MREKLQQLNIEDLKEDIRPFVRDEKKLDAWTTDLFLSAIDRVRALEG